MHVTKSLMLFESETPTSCSMVFFILGTSIKMTSYVLMVFNCWWRNEVHIRPSVLPNINHERSSQENTTQHQQLQKFQQLQFRTSISSNMTSATQSRSHSSYKSQTRSNYQVRSEKKSSGHDSAGHLSQVRSHKKSRRYWCYDCNNNLINCRYGWNRVCYTCKNNSYKCRCDPWYYDSRRCRQYYSCNYYKATWPCKK